ncbi:MAG: restriction endonuclease subunit S [Anaerolineaceae bacterium]|nr:restriction endonuclease subunit S [Anaerolineaceae bacterium]
MEPLEKHVRITSGGTPSRKKPEYWNGSIPWVKTGEINYQKIKRTEEYITKRGLKNSSAKLFPPGTLLVAMYGQGITRGRVGILDVEAATNQACAAIFPDEHLMVSYLYWYFSFAYDRIRNFGHGANQKNLSAKIISLIKVPVPPLKEQRKISSILQSIDHKVSTEQKKKHALEILFKSVLHQLMTGQIRVSDMELKENE